MGDKPSRQLLQRRPILLPTWRGWLLIVSSLAVAGLLLLPGAHSFLAVNDPKPGDCLVIEGWAPQYSLEQAAALVQSRRYSKVFVTGGPIDMGAPLLPYKSYAELGSAVMVKMGLDPGLIQPVPAPWVRVDRTYNSAVTLRKWFDEHGMKPAQLTVFTEGPHARRSRLLFQKALGEDIAVGVIAAEPGGYNPKRWWRSSAGVRIVMGEYLAYGYARFLFKEE